MTETKQIKLDDSFKRLMPKYLVKELDKVLEKYENYTGPRFRCMTGFAEVWDEYSKHIWNTPKSHWITPTDWFKRNEAKFILKPANSVKECSNQITGMVMDKASYDDSEDLSKAIKHSITVIDNEKSKKK
jgi:hypothetical protein